MAWRPFGAKLFPEPMLAQQLGNSEVTVVIRMKKNYYENNFRTDI